MRKIMAVVLAAASLGIFSINGQGSESRKNVSMNEYSPNAPQVRIQIGRRHDRDDDRYGRVRTERRTRVVRYGWRTYRETYLVRFFPDGRTQTVLVDRERIG